MSKNFKNILEQVQTLNKAEQLALISSIALMLSEEATSTIPETVIAENRRRLAAYDAGKAKGIPRQEAMLYVREQIKNRI